jgi:DNA polymerase IV
MYTTDNIDRTIVHFDLDTFFVSVERLANSSLNGKPVIIGGTSDRGVVASCSYEARQFGVHSAMPMKMARYLCPDAFIIRGDMENYSRHSRVVTNIIEEAAPLYEKASIDEHYIDISGMDRFFGSLKWTKELRQKIVKESGLPISYGLSVNKTVAKIATGEGKPNGEKEVKKENVKPFLFPLSIRKIPMIGKQTYRLLRSMGIVKIETLSQMPCEMVERVLGKNGRDIWKKANGIDSSPIIPYWEQKSMSTERTFDQDTSDLIKLNRLLGLMTENLTFELRKKQKLTSCVTVKIKYANFDTHTMQKQIPFTSFDHHLTKVVRELFRKLYQRRMLIRLIGVRFSGLVYGGQQLDLFNDKNEIIDLYLAMDKIRNRYGINAVRRAAGMGEKFKINCE